MRVVLIRGEEVIERVFIGRVRGDYCRRGLIGKGLNKEGA
jgi:hypothetical protein